MTGRRGRRRGGAELIVISWRDIPAQVTATADGEKYSHVLDDRFQHAIDRAAAVAGLTETQAYVGEWRREPHALVGDPATAAAQLVRQTHIEYDRARLEELVRAGGVDARTPSTSPAIGSDT